ncbi:MULTISPECIES: protease modulator HflC [Marinimicrobium]|jgi:membrane protease subunit HflC|uniref:Protein HflC n=1 Tax=Marinimicrobium koreense TaxID=306545 RepID=A0A3N1P0J7_9GAMM|nr:MULTISPECIES: protease modulator HflC [Marinimicrobium]MAN50610.1 HflC protein [Marinimicrobium sp.]ROQ21111.1 membrane protease subunit HflC [Marinimicrobium koreense]|tara:strand:- start:1014 stop:1952 length:939 start_codon:yes stop_codon:yes gene_type:complete
MKGGIFAIILAAVAVTVFSSAYVVDEAEQAIIVQFGEPQGDVVSEPGLHWKLPFIQEVRRFDRRLLIWDGDVTQIPTLGREFIQVDTTARWRITDPLQFLRSVRDERGGRNRLDDIVDSVVRDIVSGTELEEIVRSGDWNVDVDDLDEVEQDRDDVALTKRPKLGREKLEAEILKSAAKMTPSLGIELIDVRIKRLNYIDSVRRQVENRMISERQAIAERFRAEGQGRSLEITGEMERELRRINSEAARTAEEIRGNADAEAIKIYGEAFGADPEFYAFLRTLETYSALGDNTTLMIRADSDFFRYLESKER